MRRQRFESAKIPAGEPLYRCASCGKTDVEDPDSEFRVATDGEEYCGECRALRAKAAESAGGD